MIRDARVGRSTCVAGCYRRLSGEPSVSAAWKLKVCADLFFLQPTSLTGGSHPPFSSYVASLAYHAMLRRQGRKIAASGSRARLSASCPKT